MLKKAYSVCGMEGEPRGEGKGRWRKGGRNVGGGQNKHVSEKIRSSHVGRTIKQAIKTVFL